MSIYTNYFSGKRHHAVQVRAIGRSFSLTDTHLEPTYPWDYELDDDDDDDDYDDEDDDEEEAEGGGDGEGERQEEFQHHSLETREYF